MEEVKKEGRIALPMVVLAALQYMLPVVSVIMAGHLSQFSLSTVAIATSLTNVTSLVFLFFFYPFI